MDRPPKTSPKSSETTGTGLAQDKHLASTKGDRGRPPGVNYYGEQDAAGVDLSILRQILQLSPLERLRLMERHARETKILNEYGRRQRQAQSAGNR